MRGFVLAGLAALGVCGCAGGGGGGGGGGGNPAGGSTTPPPPPPVAYSSSCTSAPTALSCNASTVTMDGALADKSQIAGPGSILFGLHDLILDTRGTSTAADDTYAWVHVVGGPEANYTSPQTLNDGLGTVRRLTGSATGLGLEIFDVGNLLSSGLDYVQLGAFTGGPDGKAYFAVSGPNYVLMPLTGSAQYRGGTRGTYINAAGVSAYTAGDIAMTANFASRDVTGSASNFRAVNAAGASVTLPSGLDFTFTASQLLAQRHRFEGSASNATMTGTVIGEFGGPSGGGPEEAGIAYQLQTATPGGPMLFGAGGLERID